VLLATQQVNQGGEVLIQAVISGCAGGNVRNVAEQLQAVDSEDHASVLELARVSQSHKLGSIRGLHSWEREREHRAVREEGWTRVVIKVVRSATSALVVRERAGEEVG
jgi:hypothetical protein